MFPGFPKHAFITMFPIKHVLRKSNCDISIGNIELLFGLGNSNDTTIYINCMIGLNKVDMTVNSLSTDQSDFTDTGCGSNIQLRLFPSAQRTSEVGINALADDKIEGTEVLILRLIMTSATHTAVNNAGNIFLQAMLNIKVIDMTGNYKDIWG